MYSSLPSNHHPFVAKQSAPSTSVLSNSARSYHHGDLTQAAIAEGLRLLSQGDVDHLSLREIARNVGVSVTALYRHFPDKQALMRALAIAGVEQLGQAQVAATRQAGHGMTGFNASGRAYVHFALTNPALFRMMMSCGPQDDSSTMQFLRDNVDTLAPSNTNAAQREAYALRSWAIVHGLATLMLDGMLPIDSALIDAVIDDGDGTAAAAFTAH
jgi:AcrR family transcriptional regulator